MNRRCPLSGQNLRRLVGRSFSLCAASAALPRPRSSSKLPYVPTPQIVVDEMLKLARVTAKDLVIDLGSGDGRMIITAARNFKASGLGVDIDVKLVDLATSRQKPTASRIASSLSSRTCSRPTSARRPW